MARINYVAPIQFEFGAIRRVRDECDGAGIGRPLVCSDRSAVAAGLVARLTDALAPLPYVVFDGAPSPPSEAAVLEAGAAYHAHGADGVVAIGDSAAIDLGKAVALAAAHGGRLADLAAGREGGAAGASAAPVVAIPTTAGDGSELASEAAVFLRDGRRLCLRGLQLVPRAVILDPELTLDLPARLTAATGMDAIAHCIETFLSRAVNPAADAMALDGLRRAVAFLERAVGEGHDRQSRWQMMCASLLGALALQKGLGAAHALAHALGSLPLRPHHGTAVAVLLPQVVVFNEPAVADRVRIVGEVFGAKGAAGLAERIRALNARLGLPSGLGAIGVRGDQYAEVARNALLDACHLSNPKLASAEDYCAVLAASA